MRQFLRDMGRAFKKRDIRTMTDAELLEDIGWTRRMRGYFMYLILGGVVLNLLVVIFGAVTR